MAGQISEKSSCYVDFDLLREKILKEMQVRVTSQYQVTRDTGINTATLSRFLTADKKVQSVGVSADVFVTLMKWGNFAWGDVVKRRKGFGTRHTDTKDQAEVRAIQGILEEAGVQMLPGESVSQMLARVIGSKK